MTKNGSIRRAQPKEQRGNGATDQKVEKQVPNAKMLRKPDVGIATEFAWKPEIGKLRF